MQSKNAIEGFCRSCEITYFPLFGCYYQIVQAYFDHSLLSHIATSATTKLLKQQKKKHPLTTKMLCVLTLAQKQSEQTRQIDRNHCHHLKKIYCQVYSVLNFEKNQVIVFVLNQYVNNDVTQRLPLIILAGTMCTQLSIVFLTIQAEFSISFCSTLLIFKHSFQ